MAARRADVQAEDNDFIEIDTTNSEFVETPKDMNYDDDEKSVDNEIVKEQENYKDDEKGKSKGVVEMMNDYLESIFSTDEERDEEIEAELSAMYGLLWKILSATVGVIAIVITLTKYPQYLTSLHENQLWFSNIKEVEREISFRTEQGLYYSYYKHMVHSHSWIEGFQELLKDNGTEFGHTINIFHRFNILPEIVLSVIYRFVIPEAAPSVFYVWSVFLLHGVYAATLYLTAWHLSGSVLSGAITITLFLIHRTDVTRVNYTVPLRESFAVPLLTLQTLLICLYFRPSSFQKLKLFGVLVVTVALLLSWQFGPFILLCQLICLMILGRLLLLPKPKVVGVVGVLCGGLVLSCMVQSCPPLAISSPALSLAPVALVLSTTPSDRYLGSFLRGTIVAAELSLLALATVLINGFIKVFLNLDADSHIYQLFLAKLKMGDLRDFDSRLYMCTDAFDYMDIESLVRVSVTGLLPLYTIGMIAFSISALRIFLKPVFNECEDERNWCEDEDRLDSDDLVLDDHLDRMYQGITHIDSEIQKVAQLVARTELNYLLPPSHVQAEPEELRSSHHSTSATHLIQTTQQPSFIIEEKPDLIFYLAMSVVWGVLAALVVRLKVLWLPSVCVVAGVVVADIKLYTAIISHLPACLPRYLPTLCKMVFCLTYLTWLVHKHLGILWLEVWPDEVYEFWDPDTVELMEWISEYTPSSAVLAGSMQLLAGIKLCTGRSITNHPHYEDSWLRQRTHEVYRIYGREEPEAVYLALRATGATHIILEDSICLAVPNNKHPLCRLLDIVDLHNGHNPEGDIESRIHGLEDPQHPRFCDEVRRMTGNYSRFFSLVMSNKTFRVYMLAPT